MFFQAETQTKCSLLNWVPGEAVDVEVDGDHDDAGDEEGDERRDHGVRRAEVQRAHMHALVRGGHCVGEV